MPLDAQFWADYEVYDLGIIKVITSLCFFETSLKGDSLTMNYPQTSLPTSHIWVIVASNFGSQSVQPIALLSNWITLNESCVLLLLGLVIYTCYILNVSTVSKLFVVIQIVTFSKIKVCKKKHL